MVRSIIFGMLALVILVSSCSQMPNLPALNRNPLMPAVVNTDLNTLLQNFEAEVLAAQPEVAGLLQPGVTDAELDQAEAALGIPLHPEMRALYRWHNGMKEHSLYLFPGYDFYSLEEALRLRSDSNAYFKEKGMELFMAHEFNWLILFPDPAGDGYYYDYKKDYERGGIFFVFRESGYYIHFPSIKNLLAGLIECYQQGAYQGSETVDFKLEQQIMESYGRAESK